jgi:hypothetical protein
MGKEAAKVVDENTIAVVAIMGFIFTGHFEPVKVNPKKEEGETKKGRGAGMGERDADEAVKVVDENGVHFYWLFC